MAVCATALEYGSDEDVVIAALLHDAAEDQGGLGRLEYIRSRFGNRVAAIVEHCSDNISDRRKNNYLPALKTYPQDSIIVSLADKVHNARSIFWDLRTPGTGAAIWDRFKRPRQQTLWNNRALAETFLERCQKLGQIKQLAEELR